MVESDLAIQERYLVLEFEIKFSNTIESWKNISLLFKQYSLESETTI
jgi:hypothetical protein